MRHRILVTALPAIALASAIACGDLVAPAESVAGNWQGDAQIGGAYSAGMTLQQNGMSVSGWLRIGQLLPSLGIPLTGRVSGAFFTWTATYDCQVWSGTMTRTSERMEMTGSLVLDRDACVPPGSGESGTVRVMRQ